MQKNSQNKIFLALFFSSNPSKYRILGDEAVRRCSGNYAFLKFKGVTFQLSVFLKYSEQSYLRKFARNSVKLFVSYRHMKNSPLKREYFPKVCFFSYFIESGFFLSVAYLMVANLARLKISVHC